MDGVRNQVESFRKVEDGSLVPSYHGRGRRGGGAKEELILIVVPSSSSLPCPSQPSSQLPASKAASSIFTAQLSYSPNAIPSLQSTSGEENVHHSARVWNATRRWPSGVTPC